MVSTFKSFSGTVWSVSKAVDHITDIVEKRIEELRLSRRSVASRSEGAFSYVQLGNLLSGITEWKNTKVETIRGLERALDWRKGYLLALIHGEGFNDEPLFMQVAIADVTNQYVNYKIVLLSYEGNEIGERTMLVKKEHASGKLFGFTNQHATVHGISIGQQVLVKAQKTFVADDMVLVQAGGQYILAYASNDKATRVTTAQNMELKTEKVVGLAVDIISSPEIFRKPKN